MKKERNEKLMTSGKSGQNGKAIKGDNTSKKVTEKG